MQRRSRRSLCATDRSRRIASYLPAAATGVRLDANAGDDVLPWFRSNWAVNGTADDP